MIGQSNLLEYFNNHTIPQFIILVGADGSEQKQLSIKIAEILNAQFIEVGSGVNDLRELKNTSYTVNEKVVFFIENGDKLSNIAKNSMLKITEEPPKNSHFILCLTSLSNTLPTISSRGTVFNCEPYTFEQLQKYAKEKYNLQFNQDYANFCSNLKDIDLLVEYKVDEFISFVNLVIDNIYDVSGANAFKIANRIKFRDVDNGYELVFFLQCVIAQSCIKLQRIHNLYYNHIIKVSVNCLNELTLSSANKNFIMDEWILKVRQYDN